MRTRNEFEYQYSTNYSEKNTTNPDLERDLKEEHASVQYEQTQSSEIDVSIERCQYTDFREFDPGSGRTLAACLTHASRTELVE